MSEAELKSLLEFDEQPIIAAIVADVVTHLKSIPNAQDIYGYALQIPGDSYVEQPIVCYNTNSDLSAPDTDDVYEKFSVDEWQHYENDALPTATKAIGQIHAKVAEIKGVPVLELDFADGLDDYHQKLHGAFIKALQEIRAKSIVAPSVFLVFWVPDCEFPEETILKSTRLLNSEELAGEIEVEFG